MATSQTASAVVLGGSNVEGNIGSCEVKTATLSKSSFYTQTIAVNSCSGEIISNNTYYDWGYVYFPVTIVLVVALILGALAVAFRS